MKKKEVKKLNKIDAQAVHKKRALITEKIRESFVSTLPIIIIVAIMCLSIQPVPTGLLLSFLIGALLIIVGMGLFTLGADTSMTPIGSRIGTTLTKSKNLPLILFINPSEIQTPQNTVKLEIGQTLYRADEKVKFVYYLKSGALSEASAKGFTLRPQGSFLGDVQCILNQTYQAETQALVECELISFTAEEFMQIIEKSHHAARKAISKISEYTATAYNADNQ